TRLLRATFGGRGAAAPRLLLLALAHFDDNGGNVVARTLVQRQLTNAVGAFLVVGLFLHVIHHLLVGYDAAQAVGAKQEAVAGLHRYDFHLRPVAHLGRAEIFPQDVAVTM